MGSPSLARPPIRYSDNGLNSPLHHHPPRPPAGTNDAAASHQLNRSLHIRFPGKRMRPAATRGAPGRVTAVFRVIVRGCGMAGKEGLPDGETGWVLVIYKALSAKGSSSACRREHGYREVVGRESSSPSSIVELLCMLPSALLFSSPSSSLNMALR